MGLMGESGTSAGDDLDVESADDADEEWIEALFEANSDILGSFSPAWWRWRNADTARNRWIVIRPIAFAHFLERQDGVKTLYEIAVDQRVKRAGIGTRLLDEIGYPMKLKTDADNAESNRFYRALGFERVGQDTTSSGKPVNRYRKDEPPGASPTGDASAEAAGDTDPDATRGGGDGE